MAGTKTPSEDLEKGSTEDNATLQEPHTSTKTSTAKTAGNITSDDWTNSLDESHDIQVLQFSSGSDRWEVVQATELEDTSTLPDAVLIRLYLVEGLAQNTISYFKDIVEEEFFRNHRLNVLPYDRAGFRKDYFFGKWSRRAYQNHEQWDIEKRIAIGRPYNLDLITDPKDVGLNHKRYERAISAYRPYSCLEADSNTGERKPFMRQAVEDCISTCYKRLDDKKLIGLLVFDGPRKVRITMKDYRLSRNSKKPDEQNLQDCFSSFEPSRQRFREQLELPANFAALTQTPERGIRDMILRFVLSDHMEIMSDFREALDFIDEHISDDETLRGCLPDWRHLFGQWKRNLSNDLRSIAYISQNLLRTPHVIMEDGNLDPKTSYLGRTNSELRPPDQADFDKLTQDVRSLMERASSTFQAIMATMAIVESQKAIAQAETISKLTNLAFFFIPLTLCASIFGMNIKEWQDHLRTWLWVVVSLIIMFLTYMALYFKEITIALSRSPKHLQDLNVNSTARSISRSSLFFVYYVKNAGRGLLRALSFLFSEDGTVLSGIIIFLIGWSLGIWALATKLSLPYGSRVSIVVGFAIGLPVIIFFWLIIADDDSSAPHSVLKPGFAIFVILLGVIAACIWAVFHHAPLSYGERINIAVGMGVGIPHLYTLWVAVAQNGVIKRPLIATAILCAALAPSLWALITKSQLQQSTKVSLGVGLGIGLPCLVPLCYLYTMA